MLHIKTIQFVLCFPTLDASRSELQYSPLMQTVPTTATTTKLDEQQINKVPQLYRPYNHFPTSSVSSSVTPANVIAIQSNETYKSAFKPVAKRSTNPDDLTTMTQMFSSEPSSYLNSSNVTKTPVSSNSSLIYGQSQMPISYNSLNLRVIPSTTEITKDTNNFDATLKNSETSYHMPTQLLNDSIDVNKNLLKPTADYYSTEIRLVEQNNGGKEKFCFFFFLFYNGLFTDIK